MDVTALRARIPATELGDDALATILAEAYASIDTYLDSTDGITEILSVGSGDLCVLSRPASEITEVIEGTTTLAADDYVLRSRTMLQRLGTGTYPARRWRHRLTVTYVPYAADSERDRVAAELVQLEINHNPSVTSIRLGDFSESYDAGDTYPVERAAILASLFAVVVRGIRLMPIGSLLTHRVSILRRTSELDANGEPVVDADSVPVVTETLDPGYAAAIQPKRSQERAAVSEAGVTTLTHTIYMTERSITAADAIIHDPDACPLTVDLPAGRYEIEGPPRDAAGLGHHLEIDAVLTGPVPVASGGGSGSGSGSGS